MIEGHHCEVCGDDLRTDDDPDGTGTLTREGWVCQVCWQEIEDEDNEEE